MERKVLCWVDKKGNKPVRDFIEQLDDQSFKQIDKLIKMLKLQGQNLGMPYCKHLGAGLFELRDHRKSGPGFRLYFCWDSPDTIVILLVGGD